MTPAPRRGRRPGSPETRELIVEAARKAFADKGFAATSMRGVAREAGVDPALVHHYFGSKDDLFMAALALPIDPREVLVPAVGTEIEGAGTRFLSAFLEIWEDPTLQPALVAVARTALSTQGDEMSFVRDLLPVLTRTIAGNLGVDDAERRMALISTQMIGLIVMRYVVRYPPVVALTHEQLALAYAPTVQRYLTADLDVAT